MTTEIIAPRLNANDEKLEIVRWLVKEHEFVEAGQELIEVETAKATSVIHAESSGYLARQCDTGDVVRVNDIMGYLGKDVKDLAQTAASTTRGPSPDPVAATRSRDNDLTHLNAFSKKTEPREASTSMQHTGEYDFTTFSKSAKSFLKERGLHEQQFQGMGLVTRGQLEALLQAGGQSSHGQAGHSVDAARAGGIQAPAQANLTPGYEESVTGWTNKDKLPRSKQREIELLTAGQSGLINSSLTIKIKTANIRRSLKAHTKIGNNVSALILYELARSLRKYPKLNSFFANNQICYYDRVNLGLAIDMGHGLKVGVIMDADTLSLHDIASRIGELAIGYVENTLSGDDLTGGTVTITDLSGDGIVHFQPLINKDQAMILGIGGDLDDPDQALSLTCVFDHRVLSGRDISNFLSELKEQLLSFGTDQLPETDRMLALDESQCQRCHVSLGELEKDHDHQGFLIQVASSRTHARSYICNVCAAGY